jgi:hypothetical protein
MSCCQWLGFRERHDSFSFMGIAWSIRLTGNNLVFNDAQRNMKVMLLFNPPLAVRMVTKLLWRAFQSLHSPSWLILIFSFVVVEDIYRRRQPFLSMDVIYILHPTNKREVIYFSLQTYTNKVLLCSEANVWETCDSWLFFLKFELAYVYFD